MCLTGTPKIHAAKKGPARLAHDELWKIAEGEAVGDFVVAWRGWKLKRGSSPQLESANAGHTWKPKEATKAHTAIKANLDKVGVHAVKDIKNLATLGIEPTSKDCILGRVLLWGDLAEHDNGWRAEFGYPLVLYTNDLSVQCALRDAYGCPVRMRSAKELHQKGA